MKSIILFSLIFLFNTQLRASNEYTFINMHIQEFHKLDVAVQSFEDDMLNPNDVESALKSIDEYSLALENVIPKYSEYKDSENELLKKIATDLTKLLSDITKNNFQLLGKISKSDFDESELKKECKTLVDKNQFISSFIKQVSIGICMITVEERPEGASKEEQFSKLTKEERDNINNKLLELYGENFTLLKKENTKTPFQYSCVAIYEFLNMEWVFSEE